MCRRCKSSPKPFSALSEVNTIISNYYGHLYNRVSLQWLSRLVSQVPGWGTASIHVTMATKSLLHLEHIGDFILVLWGLMHHAFECVTYVYYPEHFLVHPHWESRLFIWIIRELYFCGSLFVNLWYVFST